MSEGKKILRFPDRPSSDTLTTAREALGRLSRGLRAVLDDRAWGQEFGSAAALERGAGLGRKLAWQVHRVAYSTDVLREVRNIPSSSAIERLFSAAELQGVNEDVTSEAVRAFDSLEQVVTMEAGERSAFEDLILHLTGSSPGSESRRACKAAFEANSRIWGISARSHFLCSIDGPRRGDAGAYSVLLSGHCDIAPVRRDSWDVAAMGSLVHQQKPIDRAAFDRHGCFLLPDFCSGELPHLSVGEAGEGWQVVTANYAGHGLRALHTLVFGVKMFDGPCPADEESVVQVSSSMPVRSVVLDTLIHRSFGRVQSEPTVTTMRPYSVPLEAKDRDLVHIPIENDVITEPCEVAAIDGLANYRQLLETGCRVVGGEPSDYVMFRSRVLYPPIGTALRTSIVLEPPGA